MRLIDACALQEEYKARHSGKRLLLIDVAPTVDAVPVEWIEIEIKWFKNADNAFVTLTAGQLSAMLRRWRDSNHHD